MSVYGALSRVLSGRCCLPLFFYGLIELFELMPGACQFCFQLVNLKSEFHYDVLCFPIYGNYVIIRFCGDLYECCISHC